MGFYLLLKVQRYITRASGVKIPMDESICVQSLNTKAVLYIAAALRVRMGSHQILLVIEYPLCVKIRGI